MGNKIFDALMFFLGMNFIGLLVAIGMMVFLDKIDLAKLREVRNYAIGEKEVIDPAYLKELEIIKEEYKKIKENEDLMSKETGLKVSGQYDDKLKALEIREQQMMILDKQLKEEKDGVEKKWMDIMKMQGEIDKLRKDYEDTKLAEVERAKDEDLKAVLKRYDAMEALSVAKSLLGTNIDPKGELPRPLGSTDPMSDPRVKTASYYLKMMKPGRAAEILETMGPVWTNLMQRQMEQPSNYPKPSLPTAPPPGN